MRLDFALDWPPSVNALWRAVNGRNILSRQGREYRARAAWLIRAAGANRRLAGPIEASIRLHPPDRRRRDIDNVLKALLDAMQAGGVYRDDNQIARLHIERANIITGGHVVIAVTTIEEERP